MKVTELVKALEIGSKILSHYKGKDLTYALNDILSMCQEKEIASQTKMRTSHIKEVESHTKNETALKYNSLTQPEHENINKKELDFIRVMGGMSIQEIQEYLNDKTNFPNIESLKRIASAIGLRGQSRVGRDSLIHSIVKMIDRSRIDREISSRHD